MKTWYKSRTLWLNFLALLAFILQSQIGFVFSPELQAAILTILNFVLRFDTDSSLV